MEDDHKIQKKGFRELFLPKNDLKTWSAVIIPKNMQILEVWKPNEDIKFGLEFFCTCPSTYELNTI